MRTLTLNEAREEYLRLREARAKLAKQTWELSPPKDREKLAKLTEEMNEALNQYQNVKRLHNGV